MPKKTTISVIKADVGSIAGHSVVHPELEEVAKKSLKEAKTKRIIEDYHVTHCGDDLQLIMSHRKGEDSARIHEMAWRTFEKATKIAKGLKLYGAGQDLLSDAFSGTIKGMGPGIAELEFTERKSEPVVIFMADKTSTGAFNLPLFRIFADPFNTAGLVIDPSMHEGFLFEVWDIEGQKKVTLSSPEEIYDLLALIGAKSRYVIKRIFPRGGKLPEEEAVASTSTEKLSLIAGEYVGKDDPVAIVRGQAGLPAVGEILEAFAFPQLVAGWMRGSHHGPLMPVGIKEARVSRFDGPPRIAALGFQINSATFVGPVDLFEDISFDPSRQKAGEIADYMRRHGPFEPHRLPLEEMEYTTLSKVLVKLSSRFEEMK